MTSALRLYDVANSLTGEKVALIKKNLILET